MALPQQQQGRRGWVIGLLAAFLLTVSPLPSNWPAGRELRADGPRQERPAERLRVSVQQGRLSVDLWKANLEEVLAQIGQQAGIPIILHSNSGKRISAQFSGATLEDGLRRVLRRAASSYTMLYAQGPTGRLTIQEVQVFGDEEGEPPPRSVVAEHNAEGNAADAGQSFTSGLTPPQAAFPPAESLEDEGISRLLEALARGRAPRLYTRGHPVADGQE